MSSLLSAKEPGSIIKIKENGSPVNFLVLQHGYPTSDNGRTLVIRNTFPTVTSLIFNHNYTESTLDTYFENTYLPTIESTIREKITPVDIAYAINPLNNRKTGTIQRSVFTLSATELGATNNNIVRIATEGSPISYFDSNEKRKAIYDASGINEGWYTRSPVIESDDRWCYVTAQGEVSTIYCTRNPKGIRPAFTVPSSLFVDDDGNLTVNTSPSSPSSITVPDSVMYTGTTSIEWSASVDAENNLAGYVLERSNNESNPWTQVYQGANNYYTDTVATSSVSELLNIRYRVKAYDTLSAESAYTTSSAITVINNLPPSAPASIQVTNVVAGETATITWGAATDTDGTIVSYTLERKIDGGQYTPINTANVLSYSDLIGDDWGEVSYRVCATDDDGATGEYVTSETVVVNTGYVIVNGPSFSMGSKPAPFNFTFTVSITDNEDVSNIAVSVTLNEESIYSNSVNSNTSVSIPIDTRLLASGSYTLKLSASKDTFLGFNGTYTFSVPEYELPDGGISEQLENKNGEVIFPVTLARYVFGENGKDVNALLGDGLKIKTGYYTGTGTYGSANLNTLTFNFIPKFIIITNRSNAGFCPLMVYGQPGTYSQVGSTTGYLTMTWGGDSGKTVKWYSTSASFQLNNSGQYYFYVAIG